MQPMHGRDRGLYLVASLGGHLEELEALSDAFAAQERVWVTSEGARSARLASAGERVELLPRLDRGSLKLSALLAGFRLAINERPKVVVTTGAGLAIPFTIASRLLGATVIFIESGARVTSASASGRILSTLARHTLVQWPDLLGLYRGSIVVHPVLLPRAIDASPVETGGGTFVSVGSHDQPFDRLLRAVDTAAAASLLPLPIFVQRGVSTYVSVSGVSQPFLSASEFTERMRGADVVILHGGIGAISTAIRFGKRPLVMSRRGALKEHLDDHQQELVTRLSLDNLVVAIDDDIKSAAIRQALLGVNQYQPSFSRHADATAVLTQLLR